MNIGTPLITNPQPAELVQPGQGSLHHPPIDAQATAMLSEPPSQEGSDSQQVQPSPMSFRVIGSVSLDLVWSAAAAGSGARWTPTRSGCSPSPLPPYWRNSFHQGQQLGPIMTISFSQQGRQGNPLGISNDMMFTPQLGLRRSVGLGPVFPSATHGSNRGAIHQGGRPINLLGFP